jgi:hypothetical protein
MYLLVILDTLTHPSSWEATLAKHVFNFGKERPIIIQGTCSDTILNYQLSYEFTRKEKY